MKIFVYIYEGFADFETVFTATFMNGAAEILTVSSDGKSVKAESGLKIIADIKTEDVQPDESDIFYIPGGSHKNALQDAGLLPLIKKLDSNGNIIAGICGGVDILAVAGVLKGRQCTGWATGIDTSDPEVKKKYRETNVVDRGIVTDGNIITATGQSYLELGCEIEMRFAGTPKEQMQLDYKFWKNRNSDWEKDLYLKAKADRSRILH